MPTPMGTPSEKEIEEAVYCLQSGSPASRKSSLIASRKKGCRGATWSRPVVEPHSLKRRNKASRISRTNVSGKGDEVARPVASLQISFFTSTCL